MSAGVDSVNEAETGTDRKREQKESSQYQKNVKETNSEISNALTKGENQEKRKAGSSMCIAPALMCS